MNNKLNKPNPVGEFLMTYGWAILIVLFAIGVFSLAYFGKSNPKNYIDESIYTGEFICKSLDDKKIELSDDFNSEYIDLNTMKKSDEFIIIDEIIYKYQVEDYTFCKIEYSICKIRFEDDDVGFYTCKKSESYELMKINYEDWSIWYKEGLINVN